MAPQKKTKSGIGLQSDAWERFEHAAGVVTKSPPQQREAKKKTSTTGKRKQTTHKD
jgi:hypothetical protein